MNFKIQLKISSIFLRLPLRKNNPPAPSNAIGAARYSKSSIGSPHISSITSTSI